MDDDKRADIYNFIKLVNKLFTGEARQIIYNILWKELNVHVDLGIIGAPGQVGKID